MDYEGMFKDRRLKLAGSAAWLEEMVEMGNLEFNPVYSRHDFNDGFGERITTAVLTDLAWMRIEKVIDTWLNQYS